MPTECSRDLFGSEVVKGRQVVAAFDGGEHVGCRSCCCSVRPIGRSILIGRFAAWFDACRASVDRLLFDSGLMCGAKAARARRCRMALLLTLPARPAGVPTSGREAAAGEQLTVAAPHTGTIPVANTMLGSGRRQGAGTALLQAVGSAFSRIEHQVVGDPGAVPGIGGAALELRHDAGDALETTAAAAVLDVAGRMEPLPSHAPDELSEKPPRSAFHVAGDVEDAGGPHRNHRAIRRCRRCSRRGASPSPSG